MRRPWMWDKRGKFLPRLFYVPTWTESITEVSTFNADAGRVVGEWIAVMEEEKINGFTEGEVMNFYRFVCMYEKGGFGNSNTLEDVYLSHPPLEHILPSCLGDLELQQTGLKEILKVDLSTFQNKICFNKSKNKDKALSFLAHLRNSIAHGLIFRKGQQVIITDYSITKPTLFSARGIMDYDLFMELINIINNNVNEL